MIDTAKKGRCQLSFELQSSHFFEKHSNWKNQSRWFCHIHCKPVSMVSHIFLLILWKVVSANSLHLKKPYAIIGQHLFNQINAVPREIHTPPGNK